MLDWLSGTSENNAIRILKQDHETIRGLFDQFKEAKSRPSKVRIANLTLSELKIHSAVEEDVFYPAIRKLLEKTVMNEADEEHHVAKVLIAELETMTGAEDHYDSKYHVLSENVLHHFKEEEDELFPKAKSLDVDYDVLGQQMLNYKHKLSEKGVPVFAEETMVAASRGQNDSPAKAAQKTTKAPVKQ